MKNPDFILSARARNALRAFVYEHEPEKVSDKWDLNKPNPKVIAKYPSTHLMRTNNFGWVSLAEVIAWLDEYGLKLADDPKRQRCPHCGQLMRSREAPL